MPRFGRVACRVVGQPRGTQRYAALLRSDEDALTRDIVTLASQYGRYGYRRITALLNDDGWRVGKDRVQRIWRREGLKVPKKQPARGRLWLADSSMSAHASRVSEPRVELRFRLDREPTMGEQCACSP